MQMPFPFAAGDCTESGLTSHPTHYRPHYLTPLPGEHALDASLAPGCLLALDGAKKEFLVAMVQHQAYEIP